VAKPLCFIIHNEVALGAMLGRTPGIFLGLIFPFPGGPD